MPTKNSLVPKALFFLAIGYSIALLVLSLVPLKSLPTLELINSDKVYHALAYFGLVLVWHVQYFLNTPKKWLVRPLLFICFLSLIFGILVEILQGTMTSYRSWDVFDMLADLIGILLAFVLLFFLRNSLEKLKQHRGK